MTATQARLRAIQQHMINLRDERGKLIRDFHSTFPVVAQARRRDARDRHRVMTATQASLRAIQQHMNRLRDERGTIIRGLRADSYSLREIVLISGCSHQIVANILNR